MAQSLKSKLAKSVALGMLAGTLAMTACSKHPSEEQLRALDETKKAALAAEDLLAQKRSERDNLQRQLDQKKAELQKVLNEKTAVAGPLAQ